MGERKKNKNIMCKYTSYTEKYTLYTGIEKQRLFLLKNFFINASYVIQLTALKKCCNITKVVVGKVKYILRTCILAYKYEKCIL